ncbi:hypothetical protein ACFP51_29930 [Streptomyces pratens]|uniref:Uncharacterized protein n=1 Tax=Streptomyces pratens TaxID=887456 RepID=A0ABW1LR90_9ACTN
MAVHRKFRTAVKAEKLSVWFAWASGGFVMLAAALATQDVRIVGVVGVVTQVLLVGGGIAFTITAVRMTGQLNRKAEAARRNVLGGL